MKHASTVAVIVVAALFGVSSAASAQSGPGSAPSGWGQMPPPSGTPPTMQTPPTAAPPAFQRPKPTKEPGLTITNYEAMQRKGPQGFSVVLVLGDMTGPSSPDDVPAAARKALADMKDFLPFKSYRMLDVQWTLCCGRTPVVSRLRGPDGQEYDLELNTNVSWTSDQVPFVSVRFQLTDAATPGAATGAMATEQELKGGVPAQVGQRRGASSRRPVIDASFRMDVGETVVVGTSRVKGGDKALIALLTAAPPKAGTSTQR